MRVSSNFIVLAVLAFGASGVLSAPAPIVVGKATTAVVSKPKPVLSNIKLSTNTVGKSPLSPLSPKSAFSPKTPLSAKTPLTPGAKKHNAWDAIRKEKASERITAAKQANRADRLRHGQHQLNKAKKNEALREKAEVGREKAEAAKEKAFSASMAKQQAALKKEQAALKTAQAAEAKKESSFKAAQRQRPAGGRPRIVKEIIEEF